MKLDPNTDFGQRVMKRLADEKVIWLVTVREDGLPQPTPVWFWWDGQTFLIYSQPFQQKLRNLAQHEKVALHFNSDADGDDVVVFTGTGGLDPEAPPAHQAPGYIEKYAGPIRHLGMTPEQFADTYTMAIRVTPTRVRAE